MLFPVPARSSGTQQGAVSCTCTYLSPLVCWYRMQFFSSFILKIKDSDLSDETATQWLWKNKKNLRDYLRFIIWRIFFFFVCVTYSLNCFESLSSFYSHFFKECFFSLIFFHQSLNTYIHRFKPCYKGSTFNPLISLFLFLLRILKKSSSLLPPSTLRLRLALSLESLLIKEAQD